jgi:hypothetical protein
MASIAAHIRIAGYQDEQLPQELSRLTRTGDACVFFNPTA